MNPRITRLAPSPTGAIHLGNARSFLINWLLARQNHWRIILRIEDLDGPRVKPHADEQAIQDLRWLGIDWDEGPIYQSTRLDLYRSAVKRVMDTGLAYPCVCSRREVELASSAPHAEEGGSIYPGTCRGRFASVQAARELTGKEAAIRLAVPDRSIEFDDKFDGHHSFHAAGELGDFVIAKGDGSPAYQLAVVVDDADMGVTDIVRGNDLIDSTPRQILLYDALGLADRLPNYTHVPLIIGTDGRRLAKRHGDTRLAYYRQRGVMPGRMLSLLVRWCGIENVGENISADELIGRFDLSRLPRGPITFTMDDDAWLLAGTRK